MPSMSRASSTTGVTSADSAISMSDGNGVGSSTSMLTPPIVAPGGRPAPGLADPPRLWRGAAVAGCTAYPALVPSLDELLHAAVGGVGGVERPGQVEMAHAVAEAIDTGSHLLVQAG